MLQSKDSTHVGQINKYRDQKGNSHNGFSEHKDDFYIVKLVSFITVDISN